MERQHRAALERLGERAYELERAGILAAGGLGALLATLEDTLSRIEENRRKIEALRPGRDEGTPTRPDAVHALTPDPGMEGAAGSVERDS